MTVTKSANNLTELWQIFDPAGAVDPNSEFYISRTEADLEQLTFDLKFKEQYFHGFFCGHVGSGKSTELRRLHADKQINQKYFPIYISVFDLKIENVNLTHDALLVEIGRRLIADTDASQLDPSYNDRLNQWGKTLIETLIKDEDVRAEAGLKANAWFAFFKAQLSSRTHWKHQEKLVLEPKVQDLIDILNSMALDLKSKTGKQLLVMIDDLEKGSSSGDKTMHDRLFNEYYGVLTQPRFTIIYTLPVYFKALPSKRIDSDLLYSFSTVRMYEPSSKNETRPILNHDCEGYVLMKRFVEQRIVSPEALLDRHVLDEILRIGGGLFRDTARVVKDAAYYALRRGGDKITMADLNQIYNKLKKEYQPSIRGEAITILKQVIASERGWVDGVEPFLQSRAVVEYENGDLWLDVRYVLKSYLNTLPSSD